MQSVYQNEVISGVVGSPEGPEGACDLVWALSRRQKLEGKVCQAPGALPFAGRGCAGERCPWTQVSGVGAQARSPRNLWFGTQAAFSVMVSSAPLHSLCRPT